MPFIRSGHLATLAVGVFFVLSGFVIGLTVDQKEKSARNYFVSRAARIYSVVIPALILTWMLDVAAEAFKLDGYSSPSMAVVGREFAKDIISLTFINASWGWYLTPGNNVPFWSLGFEVPYYIVFGLCFFGGVISRLVAMLFLLVIGPNVALLFILWLVGLACYHASKHILLSQMQGRLVFIFSILLLCLSPFAAHFFSENAPFEKGFSCLFQFFLSGIPFAGTIIGFQFSGLSFGRLSRPITWAAGSTFAIYLFHFPVAYFLKSIVPKDWPLGIRWVGIFSAAILISIVLAIFTERKKHSWRMGILKLLQFVPGGFYGMARQDRSERQGKITQ